MLTGSVCVAKGSSGRKALNQPTSPFPPCGQDGKNIRLCILCLDWRLSEQREPTGQRDFDLLQ